MIEWIKKEWSADQAAACRFSHSLLHIEIALCSIVLTIILISCRSWAATSPAFDFDGNNDRAIPYFYSKTGREHLVSFRAYYRTPLTTISELTNLDDTEKRRIKQNLLLPGFKYLFGALAWKDIGSPLETLEVAVDWQSAKLIDGRVEVPYVYRGKWILHKNYSDERYFSIPVIKNQDLVFSKNWRNCSSPLTGYQAPALFWYFWSPYRYKCDHKRGQHYEIVSVKIGAGTFNQQQTFPEYDRIIEDRKVTMTFAFGYAQTVAYADPEIDSDAGAAEYRKFIRLLDSRLNDGVQREIIKSAGYQSTPNKDKVIGVSYTLQKEAITYQIKVVVNAGIDQMHLFAQSFAHDQDDFFGWFGHSNLGSGFDARSFEEIVQNAPHHFQISTKYQLLYWSGCNTYSYYTKPFHALKAAASGGTDKDGTKTLDIIAHGLSAYFNTNADQAYTVFKAIFEHEKRTSYQTLIDQLEQNMAMNGKPLLAVVLGDEDNGRPSPDDREQ